MSMKLISAACAATVILGGCVTTTAPAPTASPAAAPVAQAATTGFGGMLNAERAAHGRAALSKSAKLTLAAQRHADDMARNGIFSHTGSNGSSAGDRVKQAGYKWCRIAENIAKGQSSEAAVLAGWMKSPGHRANNLLPDVQEYGIARAPGDIWVLVLGGGC